MTVEEKATEVVRRIPLPTHPPVKYIELEPLTDADGEDALRIWGVLPDTFDERRISGEELLEWKGGMLQALVKEGITLFPYVFLITESELKKRKEL